MHTIPLAGAPTLGLTGPEFLGLYAVLLVACTIAGRLWRRHVYSAALGRSARESVDHRSLSPSELAFLAGGPRRAMLTAVAVLADRGIIAQDLTTLRRPVDQDRLDPLQTRMAAVLADDPSADFPRIRLRCGAELDDLRAHLETRGLALTDRTHRRAARGSRLLWACLALLVLRGIAGAVNHAPIGGLVVLAGVTLLLLATAFSHRTTITPVGQALGAARTDLAHLAPEYRPAYPRYGELAMPAAVALFGVGALAVGFPVLAEASPVEQLAMHGTASGTSSFGSSCSSSYSGCSSDSGSGNSCGGSGNSCGSSCGGGGCGGCGG